MDYEKWCKAHGYDHLIEIFKDIDERLEPIVLEKEPEKKSTRLK